MRRTALLLASMALALLLTSGAALAEEKLDQENAGPLESYSDHEEFDSAYQNLAQVVTAGKTGELSKVSVAIEKDRCEGGSSDALYKDINVRIYSIPYPGSWTLQGSTTLPASQVPFRQCTYWSGPRWIDVAFEPGNRPRVYAGLDYAIALEPKPTSYTEVSYNWYYNGGGYYYEGGDGYFRLDYFSAGRWNEIGDLDFLFKAYVDVPDTDGDGVANDVDQCDTEPGPASNNGCPIPPDTVRPTGRILINNGNKYTAKRTVALKLRAGDPAPASGVSHMRFRNNGTTTWTSWQTYATSKSWWLTRGKGTKTVYVQYKDRAGNVSYSRSDTITYRP